MRYNKLILTICIFCAPILLNAQAIKVEVVKQNGQWQLLRGGSPYYIQGAGGQDHLDKLVEIGGNSIRTWSLEKAKFYLDEAHKRGLTVTMGLWVQHERHGFNYNDVEKVQKQLDYFRRKVTELKDHPALLMWGVGNEVDLFYTNTKVWNAVQDIAKMIHEVDPNHPTTTVTAGLDSTEVSLIMKNAPDIDIYGINTYGDLKKAVDEIEGYGWKGPYLIAEWGPNGHWEVAKTKWGAPIEQTSSEKAKSYAERNDYILADSANCIGSYVFLWGQKQETTATWYGLFSQDGKSTAPIDRLYASWRKTKPPNSSPEIKRFEVQGKDGNPKDNILTAGMRYTVKAEFVDPDGDPLKTTWQIISESTDTKSGGDAEDAPPPVPGLVKKKSANEMTFVAPKKEGAYRVFVYSYDKYNNMGYVNIPIYVKPNPEGKKDIQLKKRSLNYEYE